MLADRATKYMPPTRNDVRTYKGIGVSPGIAIGRAVIIERREASVFRVPIRQEDVESEVNRFLESLEKTRDELAELKQKVSRSMGDEYASIFEAHSMIVSDPSFADKVVQKIESEQVNAEWALAEVQEELQARFKSFDDEYLREREADVKDVADRVQTNLQWIAHHVLAQITHDVVILADDLTPSDTSHFNRRPIVGFATEAGGRTSHTSIIAKSLFMPAVIGVHRLTKIIDNDEMVIVDGYEGTLIVNPTQAMIAEYQARVFRHEEQERRLLENRDLAATTKDERRITLQANIELVEELKDAIRFGAEGIGLYRSEFLYISKSPLLPNEDEHFQLYKALAEATSPRWCVIRTFDLGGRKLAKEVIGSNENNPVLGLRGLRLCMKHRDMFRTQFRALLRLLKMVIDAGHKANIPVSLCGEMAADPLFAVVLLGLGLEVFSMNPSSIPVIKNIVRSVRYKDCRRIAEVALTKKTAQEIEEFVIESVAMRFPEGLVSKAL